jgi:hypothetical protein
MVGIAEFITARLDEYTLARTVRGEVWSVEPYEPSEVGALPAASWVVTGPDGQDGVAAVNGSYRADHIARTDPASTEAWVAAMRRVLARHSPQSYGAVYPAACGGCPTSGPCDDPVAETLAECPELRDLAAIWATHPDYQADWAPSGVGLPS